MKVKIQPGRVVRLTPKVNSSLRKGGTYDLDALGVPPEEQKQIAELDGVSIVKEAGASKAAQQKPATGGGDS